MIIVEARSRIVEHSLHLPRDTKLAQSAILTTIFLHLAHQLLQRLPPHDNKNDMIGYNYIFELQNAGFEYQSQVSPRGHMRSDGLLMHIINYYSVPSMVCKLHFVCTAATVAFMCAAVASRMQFGCLFLWTRSAFLVRLVISLS